MNPPRTQGKIYDNINDPNHYWRDKQARTEHYFKYVHGWKQVVCIACNGSGRYDTTRRGRTPKCGSCDGTGREKVSPAEYARYQEMEAADRKREEEYEKRILSKL